MPMGADPDTEDGFTQWVNSIHPAFAKPSLAKLLVEQGYETVQDAHLVTVELLRTDFSLKSGHAAKFVEAARAVQASLTAAPSMGEVVPELVQPPQFAHPTKRALAPPPCL